MGNTNKNIKKSDFKSHHPSLQRAKLIEDTNNHHSYIGVVFKCQNKEYEQWQEKLKAAKINPNGYLLIPIQYRYSSDTGLCGNTGSLTNRYPFYPYLLSDLIQERNKKVDHRYFKESELWYALFILSAALMQSNSRSLKLGDIKPQNIFVNDAGQMKVANIFSWPDEKPSYLKIVEMSALDHNQLLAPEDLTSMQGNALDNYDNTKSQVFAIGATILCTALLDTFSGVYNLKERSFNLVALREKRAAFGQGERYSDIFKAIVLNLSEVQVTDRLDCEQLWNFVSQFEEPIKRKEQFMIPSAPIKVENTLRKFKSGLY